MQKRWLLIGLMSMALTSLGIAQARAADKEAKEENEEKVSIKQVPSAVRKTLKREAMGEKIQEVDKQKLDGKTVYEVDVTIDGQNYEILVNAKGLLISKKLDVEPEEKAGEKEEKSAKDGEKKDKKNMKEEEDEKPVKAAKKAIKDKEEDDDRPAKKNAKEKEDDEKPAKKNLKDKEDDDEKPAAKKVRKQGKDEKEDDDK